MNRRQFIGTLAGGAMLPPRHCAAAPFPVSFRKPSPHEKLAQYIRPGNDEFGAEKTAAEIAAILQRLPETGSLPLAADFRGTPPATVGQAGSLPTSVMAGYQPDPQ